jgi:hypothetical protein
MIDDHRKKMALQQALQEKQQQTIVRLKRHRKSLSK